MVVPPDPIRSYRLDPAAFEATVKRRRAKGFAATLPWVLLIMIPLWVGLAKLQGGNEIVPLAMALFVGAVVFGHFRARRLELKQGKPGWDSYQLSISPNAMRRYTERLPAVEIVRPEVTQIVETPGEGLTVATADRHRSIFIPVELVDFQGLRAELAQWHAIEPPSLARARATQLGSSLLLLGLWLGTGLIPDIRLAMLAGLGVIAYGAFYMREIARSSLATNEQKARLIGLFAMFMVAPVARLIMHFAYGVEVTWPK